MTPQEQMKAGEAIIAVLPDNPVEALAILAKTMATICYLSDIEFIKAMDMLSEALKIVAATPALQALKAEQQNSA